MSLNQNKFLLFLQIYLLVFLFSCSGNSELEQTNTRFVPSYYSPANQPYYNQAYSQPYQRLPAPPRYYQPHHQMPVIPTAQAIPASRYYANPYDMPASPYHNLYDSDQYYVPPTDYAEYNGYVTPGPF